MGPVTSPGDLHGIWAPLGRSARAGDRPAGTHHARTRLRGSGRRQIARKEDRWTS